MKPNIGIMIQSFLRRYLQPSVFLVSYFVTVFLGQLILVSPFGVSALQIAGLPIDKFHSDSIYSPGLWVLLSLPFVVVPVITHFVRKYFEKPLTNLFVIIPEISKRDFVVISVVLVGYELYNFINAGVFDLTYFSAGGVTARFTLLDNLGFVSTAILLSVLPFLSTYSFIQALQTKSFFWICCAFGYFIFMSLMLVSLNMKWPITVYLISFGIILFILAKTKPLLKAMLSILVVAACFLAVTFFVWRGGSPTSAQLPTINTPEIISSSTPTELTLVEEGNELAVSSSEPENTKTTISVSQNVQPDLPEVDWVARILIFASLRMANPPVYYDSYNSGGPVCGGLAAQVSFDPPCRPSTFIYTQIFGKDGFEGKGTAPAAVHITGYSLGGWPLSLILLIIASVVLGIFSIVPLTSRPILTSLGISGAVAAYHFSQLPLEGPFIYDHGLIWLFLFLAGYKLVVIIEQKISKPK